MISLKITHGDEERILEDLQLPAMIGRGKSAELSVPDERLSRRHARFFREDGVTWVEDLGSGNGTRRNGERVRRTPIFVGDILECGDVVVEVLEVAVAAPTWSAAGYRVTECAGVSVDAVLWRAVDNASEDVVTMRSLRSEWRTHEPVVAHFLRRARTQSRCSSHWLASVLDIGDDLEAPYVVTESFSGSTLKEHLLGDLALTSEEGHGILSQILEAARDLHDQGVTLGLLHPGRIIVQPDGTAQITSLGFPLPRLKDWPEGPALELVGLPPEVTDRPDASGIAGDLFQIGALGWWIFQGQPVRTPGMAPGFVKTLKDPISTSGYSGPFAMRAWLRRMLHEEPGERFASASEALEALPALSSPARLDAAGEEQSAPAPPKRYSRRFIMINRGITVAIAFALNAGFFYWWTHRDKRPKDSEPRAEVVVPHVPLENTDPDPGPEAQPVDAPESKRDLQQEWTLLSVEIHGMLERGELARAASSLQDFAARSAGHPEATVALEILQDVQRRRAEQADRELGELEASLKADELRGFKRKLKQVRRLAQEFFPDRFQRLDEAFEQIQQDVGAPRGGSPERSGTGSGNSGAPLTPDQAAWLEGLEKELVGVPDPKSLLIRLNTTPSVVAGLPNVRYAAQLYEGWRTVNARFVELVGKDVSLQTRDGQSLKGTLQAVWEFGLRVGEDAKSPLIQMNQLSHDAIMGVLEDCPQNPGTLILSARLHQENKDLEQAETALRAALAALGDSARDRATITWAIEQLRALRGQ